MKIHKLYKPKPTFIERMDEIKRKLDAICPQMPELSKKDQVIANMVPKECKDLFLKGQAILVIPSFLSLIMAKMHDAEAPNMSDFSSFARIEIFTYNTLPCGAVAMWRMKDGEIHGMDANGGNYDGRS